MTVVLCTWGDTLESGTEEALTLAGRHAAASGADLVWLVIGAAHTAAQSIAGRYGVARLDHIGDAGAAACQPDTLVAALTRYFEQHPAGTILLNQSFQARAVAPRLAGRLQAPVIMNAFKLEASGDALEVTATAFGGDTHAVYGVSADVAIIAISTTSLVAEPAATPSTPEQRDIRVDLTDVAERFTVTSAPETGGERLEDADIIVSGGRGLGSAGNYQLVVDLADALGGMHGASRAIVDEGWIDSSRQVGLTGKITRPALYLAAGISGASQHMAGCSAAKMLVAINKDPDASIFRYARYGIVGDCLEILPELTRAVRG